MKTQIIIPQSVSALIIISELFFPRAKAQINCDASWNSQTDSCTVILTNTSTGTNGLTLYLWDFGDGQISNLKDPAPHTYSAAGEYFVLLSLTSTDSTCYSSSGKLVNVPCTSNSGISDLFSEQTISIYPNPSNGKFTIDYEMSRVTNLVICNLFGECIFEAGISLLSREFGQIDISSRPSGIYVVLIKTEKGILNRKIVLQK